MMTSCPKAPKVRKLWWQGKKPGVRWWWRWRWCGRNWGGWTKQKKKRAGPNLGEQASAPGRGSLGSVGLVTSRVFGPRKAVAYALREAG